jgi:hypothetical protein
MAPTGWTTFEYQGPSVTDARLQDLSTGGDFTDEVHAVAAELLQRREHEREALASSLRRVPNGWCLQRWICPLTGWWSPYRWLWRR